MGAPRHILAVMAVLLVTIGDGPALASAQDQQVRVGIVIAGHEAMWFVPRNEPYTEGGPGVCSAVSEADAKTKDGTPVRGFEFIGWNEGEGYRVMVFALVPSGTPGNGMQSCTNDEAVRRMDFGSVLLETGTEVAYAKMKEVGVTPWVIRAYRKDQ